MLTRRTLMLAAAALAATPIARAQSGADAAALAWIGQATRIWSDLLGVVVHASINPVFSIVEVSRNAGQVADLRSKAESMRADIDAGVAQSREAIAQLNPPPSIDDARSQAILDEFVADQRQELDRVTALGLSLEGLVDDFASGAISQEAEFRMAIFATFGEMNHMSARGAKLARLGQTPGGLQDIFAQAQVIDFLTQSLLYNGFLAIARGHSPEKVTEAQTGLRALSTEMHELADGFTEQALVGLLPGPRESMRQSLPRLHDLAEDQARLLNDAADSLSALSAEALLADITPAARLPAGFVKRALPVLEAAGFSL